MSPKRKLNRKLIFIPPWVGQVQKTYNLPNSELISLAPLLDILTMEDVSFYYACNEIFKTSRSFSVFTDTFDMVDLFSNTRKAIGSNQQVMLDGNGADAPFEGRRINADDILQDVSANTVIMCNDIKSMSGHTNNMDNTIAAIQQSLSKVEHLKQNVSEHVRDNYVFEMLLIDDEYIGITFAKGNQTDNHRDCYKKCIELLCTLYPFEEVAQTSIFSSWTGTINI